jgi:F-type H+-transporting ATPase subunit b
MVSDAKNTAIAEAEKVAAAATADIENKRLAAIHDIKVMVADLSIDIAEKVLRAELTGDKQKDLIEASIKESKLN